LGKPAKDRPDGVEGRGDVFSDYVIGAEDVVEVSVWKNEPLSKVVTVRPDGKISLPLIGDVQAAGLTASELKKAIMEKLLEYKETPTVSVIVQQVNSYAVYITGEVLHPGKYPVKSPVTLLQGITLAGGFTPYASKNNILLLRGSRSGGIRIKVKYKDILSGRKGSVDPILLPGDTVVIP
jgi:polysaccharide export outer membrane protein